MDSVFDGNYHVGFQLISPSIRVQGRLYGCATPPFTRICELFLVANPVVDMTVPNRNTP